MLWINLQVVCLSVACLALAPAAAQQKQQEAEMETALAGAWVINEQLSDNTDRRVEEALREAGRDVRQRLFDFSDERYRGGPEEQELYDRIAYDDELTLELNPPEYLFTYEDDFTRSVYMDNRQRSVSLSNIGEVEDFSLGHWEDDALVVEGRPRDGGFTEEIYTLTNEGSQLRVELTLKPRTFQVPIKLVRVYDRPAAQ